MKLKIFLTFIAFSCFSTFIHAQEKENEIFSKATFAGLKFRSIGPAFMSGRIADIAIHPENENIWYVAVGSGGVWKTVNSGTSWTPVFDSQPVYSIGCVTIDPINPHIIWVGTGENVGGRHVGYGDGIYKSTDGGASWKNMGLKKSEHISKIIIYPKNSDIIWVAAQGPLWTKGGDRGVYKSTDGGKNWKKTLGDNEWVGVTDIAIDSRDPNRIYAATWQRHRNVAAYMGSGPGSGLHRSDDGGETWKKLKNGLPKKDMGKIGLAISPQNPDVLYAAIELERRSGAVYKTMNRGESWKEQSKTVSSATGPHYYQELYASPHQFDKIYLADSRMKVSENGGKNFREMERKYVHVDFHAVAFKKNDPGYLLVGSDGGLYESFDLEKNWRYISNLPVTQFYKIAVDDSEPFYTIYGGTQDNATQAGPSRTDNMHGIANSDWETVLGGDGHQPAVEPGNPDIVYAQSQQGFLTRIDRITGERLSIQPQPEANESYERFNWDSPVLVSPHSPTRLYFASHRVWRSDNRGDEWTAISGDLTKNQERLNLPIMGKKQSWDASWDFYAMSNYNTITSLAESPKKEGLIYAGTDDGLIQITEDGGKNWRKIPVNNLPEVPSTAFVNDIKADLYDVNTVYIALDNHKFGDYKPYLYKSTNKGKTWEAITGNLSENLLIWRIVQDHVNPNLFFLATEFGVYFSTDAGTKWIKLSGTPTISFRDLAIQKRENDLVAASFGRGIYILDDYSALRNISPDALQKEALLFTPRKAWWYAEKNKISGKKQGSQGQSYFLADNPPFGVNFTYYLKDNYPTIKELRQKKEKELKKNNQDIEFPGWDNLDKEKNEEKPKVWLTILNDEKQVVRKISVPAKKGIHRVSWDLKIASKEIIKANATSSSNRYFQVTHMVEPGIYRAFLSKEIDGKISLLTDSVDFEVEPLLEGALKGADYEEITQYWKKVTDLYANVQALNMAVSKSKKKIKSMHVALDRTSYHGADLYKELHNIRLELQNLEYEMQGSPAKREIFERQAPRVMHRLYAAMGGLQSATYGPTVTQKRSYQLAEEEYKELKKKYEKLKNESIPGLERKLIELGAPYIEGQDLRE